MLFDPEPKKKGRDFYNREAELRELLASIEITLCGMVTSRGQRMAPL